MGLGEIWQQGIVEHLAFALRILHDLLAGYGLGDVPLLGNLSWGLTIILFTLVVKIITVPLTVQQLRSSRAMQVLQPQLKALQKQYGKDKERLMQEQMRLYKEHKINPAAGCLPLLIQMPIWFGLYQALYFLARNGDLQAGFLWLHSLALPEGPPYAMAILTGISQWVVQRMMTPRSTDPTQQSMNQAMQFMPIMFVFFAFSVPSGLVLYWVTSNLFSVVQQYFMVGWGALFPLPFIGGKAGTSREVTQPGQIGTNGKRPAGDEKMFDIPASNVRPVDGVDGSSRGPGGGKKKKRIKRQ